MKEDNDSPWKLAVEWFLPSLIQLLFPQLAGRIDWARGYVFKAQELTRITPKGSGSSRRVDKLVEVWLKDGTNRWLFIHIEVQAKREKAFARRMFFYWSRIYEEYGVAPISLAILIDDSPGWRPSRFVRRLPETSVQFRFSTAKILDWDKRREELATSTNPFAAVVLARLEQLATRKNPESRTDSKLALWKSLYRKGWDRASLDHLFLLVDMMMRLPEKRDQEWYNEVVKFEEEQKMPWISTAERLGLKRGLELGRLEHSLDTVNTLLSRRYGEGGQKFMEELKSVKEGRVLDNVLFGIVDNLTIDELRTLLTK